MHNYLVLYLKLPASGIGHDLVHNFSLVIDHYKAYNTRFNTSTSNFSGVLDNSSNVKVLKDKSLFTSTISYCPHSMDVDTVFGSNNPAGIGHAKID